MPIVRPSGLRHRNRKAPPTLRSISQTVRAHPPKSPNHRLSSARFVSASKTSARGASKTRVITISRSPSGSTVRLIFSRLDWSASVSLATETSRVALQSIRWINYFCSRHQFAYARFLLVQVGIACATEVSHFEQLANLDITIFIVRIRNFLSQRFCFFEVFAFPNPVAGDQLLGFGEGSVNHCAFVTLDINAGSLRAGL